MQVTGSFDVTLTPQAADNPPVRAAGIGRMSIDKQYHGALTGPSGGEMLSTRDASESGSYVAIERFRGTLDGRRGSFALVHRADMRRGVIENWTITVVPDSGTDQLAGLEGKMRFVIEGAKHSYEFEYSLP